MCERAACALACFCCHALLPSSYDGAFQVSLQRRIHAVEKDGRGVHEKEQRDHVQSEEGVSGGRLVHIERGGLRKNAERLLNIPKKLDC